MLRILSAIFLALALIFLGADLEASGGALTLRDAGYYWFVIDPESLQLAQPAIERHVWPALWDPGIVTLLTWPAVFLCLGLSILFFGLSRLFGRKPPARITAYRR